MTRSRADVGLAAVRIEMAPKIGKKKYKIGSKKTCIQCILALYLRSNLYWAISSAGSEHLVYTEGVGSSNLSSPTLIKAITNSGGFFHFKCLDIKI